MSKSNFEFQYKIFSVFSFFYIYLLVFNSSVYIYLPCKDVFCHLSDFFKSSKIAKTRNYPYPLPESDPILEFSSHVSHFVFNVVFVRYDFTRIYTLFVGDFLYKASGWTKWTSLSWIIMMKISFEIVYLETLVKRFAKLFFYFLSSGRSVGRS